MNRPPATALREPLGVALGAWQAPLLVHDDPRPFALIGDWLGARALVGSCPVRSAEPHDDPFALLDEQPIIDGDAPRHFVGGGWVGGLGYGLGGTLEAVGAPPSAPVPLPLCTLALYDHLLRLDADGAWWLEAFVTPEREGAIRRRFAVLRERAAALGDAGPRTFATAPWGSVPSPAGHRRAVDAAVERIAHGDLFQANVAVRRTSRLTGELVDLFVTAGQALTPAKAAWLQGPWGGVASLSPELYLRRAGDRVRSSPIKGTRRDVPGGREALLAAEKDHAEHVMIVDLVRNDLGRVCEPGSVEVTQLASARRAPGVWNLVSDVDGTLRPGTPDAALVRATFPPGSVTGAPKVAAMKTIHELESTAREAYTGALGIAAPTAGLDLNVAIRTFEHRDGRLWLGAGGGVVADSTGDDEAREADFKAAPLLAAIGATVAPASAIGAGPRPPRLGPVALERPDPALGLFETLCVDKDGGLPQLDAHLARLSQSRGGTLPGSLGERLVAAACFEAPRPGRLRVDVLPDGTTSIVCGPLPEAGAPVALRAVCVPGGFGAVKWADRRPWDALAAAHPGELVLLVDLDGFVLETARASLFARFAQTLVTPPLDGRILPGTTRARFIADTDLAVVERPIALHELHDADAVLLTGALRGVENAASLDGTPLRRRD